MFHFFLRFSSECGSDYEYGYSGRESEASSGSSNSDVQVAVKQILQNLKVVRSSKEQLVQLWNEKKLKLDQCFQLRLFEQDCEKVR